MQFGKFVQEQFGAGVGRQDAADRRQREGAEADGTLEGGLHVVALVVGDQGQQLLGLQFALDLLGEQAIEELHGDGTKVTEALPHSLRGRLSAAATDSPRPQCGLALQAPAPA